MVQSQDDAREHVQVGAKEGWVRQILQSSAISRAWKYFWQIVN
jgi:hypothetical protein